MEQTLSSSMFVPHHVFNNNPNWQHFIGQSSWKSPAREQVASISRKMDLRIQQAFVIAAFYGCVTYSPCNGSSCSGKSVQVLSTHCQLSGAPTSACENMMPVHIGVQPQASPAPYEIQVDASSFMNRQPINVQVVGPGYRGLLLEARTFGSIAALGTWQTPANNTKFLQCSGNPKGAITHSNTEFKTNLTTYTWLPPTSGCPAVITFM
ncbi:hypothetical protein KIL84_022997 [Mauremys mutica]|uniref:Reelin domain-containing protein n=1 Tax=Mauremys mutica TaxID=74926 RepID=A0A9D3WRU5_9SAUR|nr:hypothetical protein KIL84_022997 [Mauremys mutica]